MHFLEFLKEMWGARRERKEEGERYEQETKKRSAQVKVKLARIDELQRAKKQSLDSFGQK